MVSRNIYDACNNSMHEVSSTVLLTVNIKYIIFMRTDYMQYDIHPEISLAILSSEVDAHV
jgi:hypothetical protein